MSTAVLTHSRSLSLVTFPKPITDHVDSSTLNPTPLALPSRFPPTSSPCITLCSSTSSTFLHCPESPFIWEYDHRGRRVAEMNTSTTTGGRVGVRKILSLGMVGSKETVFVGLAKGTQLKVMEKDGGKWKCINALEGPNGTVTALTANTDATLVAAGSDLGQIVIFDQNKGTRVVLPPQRRLGPISPLMSFAPSLSSTLVVPYSTTSSLSIISLPMMDVREIHTYSDGAEGPLCEMGFSPVVDTSEGRKGGLCASVRKGEKEVALIGLDNPNSAAKMVDFGSELCGVTFLDGATLAGCTTSGALLITDLRALHKDPVQIKVEEPITGVHLQPTQSKASRPSVASASGVSTKRAPVLGEARNAGNIDPPRPIAPLNSKNKGKEVVRTAEVAAGQKKTARIEETTVNKRVVSAPSPTKTQPRPAASSSRSASNPAPTLATAPRPSSAFSRAATPMARQAIIEEEEDEEDMEVEMPRTTVDGVNLSWALRTPATRQQIKERTSAGTMDSDRMEEMRREIGNLQLDMLRMGRGLKNEIRRAVEPLLHEIHDNREVIERQRREIERLRRGF